MKIKLILGTLFLVGLVGKVDAGVKLVGKPAPLFTAQIVCPDGSVRDFNLKEYIGNKIVLYFYPMDDTPGCTKQAECFCKNMSRLEAEDIILLGVSCDSVNSHMKFQKKYSLPYPLISDSRLKRTISKMYGADGFLFAKRKTYLINTKGIVFKVFEHITIENQIDDILNAFKAEKRK